MTRSIFAVTGSPGSGKTVYLAHVLNQLRSKSIRLAGVIQPREPHNGERDHYRLLNVKTGQEIHFAQFINGKCCFDCGGFEFASSAFLSAQNVQVLFADELGNLEAQKQGHWPALEVALAQNPNAILLCILKKRHIETFKTLLPPFRLLDVEDPSANFNDFTQDLLDSLSSVP